MCVLCYYGGKKAFPIPYQIKRMAIYLLVALILFGIGYFVNINVYIISLIFRIVIIAAFLYVILRIEKIDIVESIRKIILWK